MNFLAIILLFVGAALVLLSMRYWAHHRRPFPKTETWSPAKQLIYESLQERSQKLATYSMIAGLFILWGNVLFIAVPYFYFREKDEMPEARAAVEVRTSIRVTGCVDKCGDGACTALSCIQQGCACAESYKTCAKDCSAPPES